MVESIIILLIPIALFVAVLAGGWKMYQKAGEPGWAFLIPIYNAWVLVRITRNEWWWFVLLLVPLINIIAGIKILHDLSKSFGHGVGFTLGLFFFSVIFIPILGFGSSQYRPLEGGTGGGHGGQAAPAR